MTEEFATAVELWTDKLLPRGYSYCKAQEYHLGKGYRVVDITTICNVGLLQST